MSNNEGVDDGDAPDLETTDPIPVDAAASTSDEPEKSTKLATARVWAIDLLVGGVIAAVAVLGINWWNDRNESTNVDTNATTPTSPQFTFPSAPLTTAPATSLPDGCAPMTPNQQGNGEQYVEPGDAELDATKTYTAIITTSCGVIEVDLDVADAPISANNFAFLAREGFFDGLTWHRAVTNFVIQGGDPDGTGAGGPGYSVPGETPDEYQAGTVAWAKSAADPAGTAGSQFFITTGDAAPLNASCGDGVCDYGIIGHVVNGLDNAKKIESLSLGDGPPRAPVYIISVVIAES